ncbi:hypothetical protein L1049_004587 [Liquidambar formosana]|uniref:rRNA-processing protein FYV7 n=1 Tax=Liquidambar formosana TaxID=63359 RepID=A0AAP0RPQ6_LIQFO
MKSRTPKHESHESREQINGSKSFKTKKMKNMRRLGGGGLSLETFLNAKSKSSQYNPAMIKKQREFYKNAKYVSKYKKSLKQQNQQNDFSLAIRPREDDNKTGDASCMNKKNKKNKTYSLRELYEKKQEEEEKARTEREAIIQAKKEEKERAESQRRATREKMFKKTRSGQPVMKYKIEHLLETIQGSTKNSVNRNP